MPHMPIDYEEKHESFLASQRKYVLMITNHGIHQWHVVPGLPDTGGQNVFVNQFTNALAKLGFKFTVVNRGGYPHPVTGEWHKGLRYTQEIGGDEHLGLIVCQQNSKIAAVRLRQILQ